MNLDLTRIAYLPDVTLGRLRVGAFECCTLEEPWLPNPNGPGGMRRDPVKKTGESCIPDGDYIITPHNGTLFKNVWRLSNHDLGVFDFEDELESPNWGRATVLIHSGNHTGDILGCLLVGMEFGRLDNKPAVLRSRNALEELRRILGPSDLHSLSIRPTRGTLEIAA